MKASELLPGDIILNREHTMIAIGEGFVVDAWGRNERPGVDLWHWADTRAEDRALHEQWVYRPKDPGLGSRAAGYARGWAKAESRTLVAPRRTRVPERSTGTMEPSSSGPPVWKHEGKVVLDDRRQGVTWEVTTSKVAPPFSYDAFRRALKYALRIEKGFSANRGTTCCAFVIACHQAAALAQHAHPPVLQEIHDAVAKDRAPKPKGLDFFDGQRIGQGGKLLSPLIVREKANAGRIEQGLDLETYLTFWAEKLTMGKCKNMQAVFSSEMYIDAQFTHSMRLLDHMAGEGPHKAWACVLEKAVIAR